MQIKMDELIAELRIVYRNYCSGVRELEHFHYDLFGKNGQPFGPQQKSKLAGDLNHSEESGNLDVKIESSAKPQHEHSKQEKNELAQEMEGGKRSESVPKKTEKCKCQNKQQAGQLSETQNECKKEKAIVKCPGKDMLQHLKTKEALENAKIQMKKQDEKMAQIQSQLRHLKGKVKCLQNDYNVEKSAHQKTKEVLENGKEQKRTQDEKNIQIQNTLKQLKEKIKGLGNELHVEKAAHQKTKEALEAAKSHAKALMNKFNHDKKKKLAEKEHPTESHLHDPPKVPEMAFEELRVQLQQTKADKQDLKDNYEKEKAEHRNTKEELGRADSQMKGLAETCEGLRQRLQNNEKKVKEDLLACMSVLSEPNLLREAVGALQKHYLEGDDHVNLSDICEEKYKLLISDLKTKIENCTALLEASLKTKTKLEEKLSNMDNVYTLREQKYVKLINVHIILVQCLEKRLRNHTSKCKNPVQEKVCSWFHKNVLQNPADLISDNRRPLNLFPHDWRLPGIPEEDLS